MDEGSGKGQAFVGTWDVIAMYPIELESEMEKREGIFQEFKQRIADTQMDMYLVLYDDGIAAQALYGGNSYGEWTPIDDSSAKVVFGSHQYNLVLEDSQITYEDDNDHRWVYEKGTDKVIVPYDEYAAFLDGFMGQWEGVSMSRDGEEVQMEPGYLIYDIQKNGDIVVSGSHSEEETTFTWCYSNTKGGLFMGAPSQNETLRIEDGYLVVESTGEYHWVTKFRAM